MHETRKGEMAAVNELPFGKYYGGVDTTPLFVMLAAEYARRTGDLALSTASGVRYWQPPRSPIGPIALIEVQGYAFAAFRGMARLSRERGVHDSATRWNEAASALAARVESKFWRDELQFYALALDGRGDPCRVLASNAGHLLFTGLPSPERGRTVARQLLTSAFDTGWGVRTLAANMARFNPMSYHNGSVWPHDVALCAAGMARYGERDGVVHLLGNMFEAAINFGLRLPELYCGFDRAPGEAPVAYPVACLPQAWAAGSVFMLLQSCLGIHVDGREHTLRVDRPFLPQGVETVELVDLQVGPNRIDVMFRRVNGRVVAFAEQRLGGKRARFDIRY